MISPRVALASGAAGAAGALIILTGAIEGSAVLLLVLVLAASVAPAAASESGRAARDLARQFALAPAWVGIAVVASMRAGSISVGDLRGANAVAGLAVVRGDPLLVAGCIVAAGAGVVALAVFIDGLTRPANVAGSLAWVALALQSVTLVTFFAGPQIRGARDLVPWVAGVVVVTAAAFGAHRMAKWHRVPSLATGTAALSLALALAGAGL